MIRAPMNSTSSLIQETKSSITQASKINNSHSKTAILTTLSLLFLNSLHASNLGHCYKLAICLSSPCLQRSIPSTWKIWTWDNFMTSYWEKRPLMTMNWTQSKVRTWWTLTIKKDLCMTLKKMMTAQNARSTWRMEGTRTPLKSWTSWEEEALGWLIKCVTGWIGTCMPSKGSGSTWPTTKTSKSTKCREKSWLFLVSPIRM